MLGGRLSAVDQGRKQIGLMEVLERLPWNNGPDAVRWPLQQLNANIDTLGSSSLGATGRR